LTPVKAKGRDQTFLAKTDRFTDLVKKSFVRSVQGGGAKKVPG
jgi:hypothetical protein